MSWTRRIITRLAGAPLANVLASFRIQLRAEWGLHRMHRHGVRQAAQLPNGAPLKLHLGCGNVYKPGWLNIDGYSQPPCTPDLTLDLRQPLPFPDARCAWVYSEHFFEHVPYPDGATAHLRECFRVLRPGGRLSIGVPDPRPVLEAYLNGSHTSYYDYFFHHISVKRHLHTPMEAVNWLFRQGGEHQFIYDFPSLKQMLSEAGFTAIRHREFDCNLDSEPRRLETLYVDGIKPA